MAREIKPDGQTAQDKEQVQDAPGADPAAQHRILLLRRRAAARRQQQAVEQTGMRLLEGEVKVEAFLDAIAYYGSPGFLVTGVTGPQAVPIGEPALDALAEKVRAVVFIATNPAIPDRTMRALDLWGEARSAVWQALSSAHNPQIDPGKLAHAEQAFQHLDDVLTNTGATQAIDKAARKVDLGAPDAGYLKATAKVVDQAVMSTRDLLAKTKDLGGSMLHTEGSEALGSSFELVQAIVVEAPELAERLEKAKEKGLLAATATVADLLKLELGAVKSSISLVSSTAKILLREKGEEEAATLADRYAGMAESTPLESATRLLGGAMGFLDILSGTASLIDAIKSGDTRAALAAGHTIAQGGVGLGSAVLGAGAEATAMVGLSVFLFYEGIDMMGVLGGILKEFEYEHIVQVVGRFVAKASELARVGALMAGAAQAAEDAQKQTKDPALQEKIMATIEARGNALATQVARQMAVLSVDLESHDRESLGHYPDLVRVLGPAALRELDPTRIVVSTGGASPEWMVGVCRTVFPAIDRMGRYAVDKYGDARHSDEAKGDREQIDRDVDAEEND